MSKLDELIQELCPKGVEYKALGNIADIKRGERITKKDLIENGKYPVISGGINPLGYYNKANRQSNTITIAQYGTAGYVNFQKKDFWANDVCYSVFPSNSINNKYLYYCLMNNQAYIYSLKTEAIPAHLPSEKLKNITIPVPPIEVQKEIVRILDNFTALTAELTTELTARKKQYEYYKCNLLKFNSQVKLKCLNEIAIIYDSLHKTPKYSSYGYPMIRVTDIKGGYVNTKSCLSVDKETYKIFTKKYKPQYNDIIISRVGSYGNFCIVGNEDICLGQNTSVIHPTKIEPRFLYYVLNSDNVTEFVEKNIGGGSQKTLSLRKINEIPIPLPPLEEQQRIVAILDRFDTLCNDITKGIPAEIEARNKQYEYYRDKLLTFRHYKEC